MVVAPPPGEGVVSLTLHLKWPLVGVLIVPGWSCSYRSVCSRRIPGICSAAIFSGSEEEVAIVGTPGTKGARGCTSREIFVGRPLRLMDFVRRLFEQVSFCMGLGLDLDLDLGVGVSGGVGVVMGVGGGGRKCS